MQAATTSSSGWLPLLARCAFTVALVCAAVFLAIYPDRKAERDDYDRSRPCAADVRISGTCRLTVDAVVIGGHCRDVLYQAPDDVCEMQLRVGDAGHVISVDRRQFQRDKPGATVRVELFRGKATGIREGDRFIERRGSPREAIETLTMAMWVWAVIGAVSGAYLYRRRRMRAFENPAKS